MGFAMGKEALKDKQPTSWLKANPFISSTSAPIRVNKGWLNKFGTNNNASWMKQDEEEDEDEDEEEDEEEDSLLTSQEQFRMITKLLSSRFTV